MTKPNPYNAKKEWQGADVVERGPLSADDSLFYPQAPSKPDDDEGDVDTKHPDNDASLEESRSQSYQKTDYKKRYDDLKRHYDRKLAEHKAEVARLEAESRANRPTYKPPKTPEELATFKEDNPDVYDIVETVAHMRSEAQIAELQRKIDRLTQDSQTAAFEKAKAELLKLHPDFEEIVNTDEFHEWAKSQPSQIQDWVYRNGSNAKLAARAMDLYKKDSGASKPADEKPAPTKTPQKRQPSAADAVVVSGKAEVNQGNKRVWTHTEIAKLSLREYEKYQEEIDDAFADGRVVQG